MEKECLAIKLAIQHFFVYLLGRKFRVQTDHRALQWLTRAKETNARLLRWSLALQLYDFIVEHRKGKDNANADTLSRMVLRTGEGGRRGNAYVATPGQPNGPMKEEDKKVATMVTSL